MDHITNYSAHLESSSVKQLCEQTRVHRWEPISDKMFTNKRIDLLANLGTLTWLCEWQTQVSTEHWAVSTGHRVYNVYGLGIDLHAPRQSECWLTPARHLTPMFTNEHLHHQKHQQHQQHQHHQKHKHLHPHLPSISCKRLSLVMTLLQAKSHNCKKLGPKVEIVAIH